MKNILVTGCAGFIASHLTDLLLEQGAYVYGIDALTYAGNKKNLPEHKNFTFEHVDTRKAHPDWFDEFPFTHVVHCAAESHVDRSIEGPEAFFKANIEGTWRLLEALRLAGWGGLFVHLSTDEVFGDLGPQGFFDESSPYRPHSPYSASKAAADHLVRAYAHTYGLRAVNVNCTNNYGPRQYPEKLIPRTVTRLLQGLPAQIHGTGGNVRDWIHVRDCVRAIAAVVNGGRAGETYCVGGGNERTNLEVVREICTILDEIRPAGKPHARLITHVKDRAGNDRRYAVDTSFLERRLGWKPQTDFSAGLRHAVKWYLSNPGYWSDRDAGDQSK